MKINEKSNRRHIGTIGGNVISSKPYRSTVITSSIYIVIYAIGKRPLYCIHLVTQSTYRYSKRNGSQCKWSFDWSGVENAIDYFKQEVALQ